ncbi:MAG TPA: Rid family detoxifying hydrolase [Gemmatimonadales bacterium]
MTRQIVTTDKIAPAVGPFAAAVNARGVLYVSGQVALDPKTGKLIPGDVAAQAEQIFRNLAAVLEAAGKSFADVSRVGVYLTNMGDFAAMNAVYARHFEAPYPARTTIGVAALPLGASVEMDLVAG